MATRKIKNQPDLERDMSSKAIINTNRNAYNNHIARRNRLIQKDIEIAQLKSDVEELKKLVDGLSKYRKSKS